MNSDSALNYVSYLQLDQILTAQKPRSDDGSGRPEHDEMLFIIIHQVYELWFKQMLHETDFLIDRLQVKDPSMVLHTFRRILTILKTAVAQIDILETMTPLEFNAFRSFLESSSGFQSVQFRELEFLLGHKREAMMNHFPDAVYGRSALEKRFKAPTLWDAFLHYLHAVGFNIPSNLLERDVTQPIQPSPELQDVLIDIYRHHLVASRICERFVDLDEGLQEWRYRHVKMVARTIGSKPGTGGSPGVKYLETTIRPLFPDLWEIRAKL